MSNNPQQIRSVKAVEMSDATTPNASIIGARGLVFCQYSTTPLLQVRAEATSSEVIEQAYELTGLIHQKLKDAARSGDTLDTTTLLLMEFAAGAAEAMVGSMEVK
jgi:hypothetical protein